MEKWSGAHHSADRSAMLRLFILIKAIIGHCTSKGQVILLISINVSNNQRKNELSPVKDQIIFMGMPFLLMDGSTPSSLKENHFPNRPKVDYLYVNGQAEKNNSIFLAVMVLALMNQYF